MTTHRSPTRRGPPPSTTLLRSWASQSWPVRILRAFLGVTFVFAGTQKFFDPNFLHAGNPQYIGTQLHDFARGSPIRPLLLLLAHLPLLTGVTIALLEIAVGLGTLLGIASIAWAVVGMSVSLILFLSATWHVHPYFLGSDSIYAVAWGALMAGMIEQRRRRARAEVTHGSRRQRTAPIEALGRREFLRGAIVGIGSLILGVASSVLAGKPTASASTPPPTTGKGPGPKPGHTPPMTPPSQGTVIASLDSVPIGGAVPFTDPQGGPAMLCRLAKNRVAAFSRVCTHAGCLVEYDSGARLLVCPCHGAEFDPAKQAEPIAGPAFVALSAIAVSIDASTGEVVAQA